MQVQRDWGGVVGDLNTELLSTYMLLEVLCDQIILHMSARMNDLRKKLSTSISVGKLLAEIVDGVKRLVNVAYQVDQEA